MLKFQMIERIISQEVLLFTPAITRIARSLEIRIDVIEIIRRGNAHVEDMVVTPCPPHSSKLYNASNY